LKQYAVKHSLYREALDLYKYQAEQLREMTRLYADYLYSQSNYQEAAIGKNKPDIAVSINLY
jgi:elongator complex protein 1